MKLDAARKRQILTILAVFVCVVCLDQITKTIVRTKCPEEDLSFLRRAPEFFCIAHQTNPGLVGGMFRNSRLVALAAPLIASAVLLYLFLFLDAKSRLQALAYGLVAGGAVGNLIDRVRLGHVTDFLQFNFYFIPFDFPWKIYPAFNIADSAICTGVFLLVLTWHTMKEDHVPDAA